MLSAELFGEGLHRSLAGFLQRYLASPHECFIVDLVVTHDTDATSRSSQPDRPAAPIESERSLALSSDQERGGWRGSRGGDTKTNTRRSIAGCHGGSADPFRQLVIFKG